MQILPARLEHQSRLSDLWTATFPQLDLPAPEIANLPDGSSVWVGQSGGRVEAGVVITRLADEPRARRLQVLAGTDERWGQMHTLALAELHRANVARWYVVVREDSHEMCRRLVSHGYAVVATSWGAHLVIDTHTLDYLRELGHRHAGTLVMREVVPSDVSEVHRLYLENRADFPSTPATEAQRYTLDEMRELVASHRAFGAWQRERLIAVTVLRRLSTTTAETEFTVTERAFRHQGVGTALKAHSVCTLAVEGVRRFSTGGAQVNEASLRANQRLRYRLEPRWLTYSNDGGQPSARD